jgi:hypothetical protein
VTNNPHQQAPIPLYPVPSTGKTKFKKVKVKLCRNLTVASFPNYENSYTQWTEHTVEGYYKFRAMLVEYVKQDPLNNVNEQVNAVSF